MKNKIKYFLCGSLMVCAIAAAQDEKTNKAEKEFDNYSYANAIEKYETLVDKGHSQIDIYKNLGDANYKNANYSEAANWYSKLFKLEQAAEDPEYMYRYAQALKSSKEYEASAIWMKKYQAAKSADIRAEKSASNPDYMKKIEMNSNRYDVKSLSLNSTASDFAPSFYGEQLVFSTARDSGTVTKNVHTWNNQPFTNLYVAKSTGNGDFSSATKLAILNKKTHETSAVFTKDGSTVYFTRNNSDNGRFTRDETGVSRLQIFSAKFSNGNWKDITSLPFNSDEYSTAHPALSPDDKKLYFASDMEGTTGESDIFVATINDDGTYGNPENLGTAINTEGRETFPFVTASNVLYFSSDGHPGLGGLDIFATKISDMNNLYVVNVGKSVNSEKDDFSFIINDETKKGFFASNRDGGLGNDDIYGFTENEQIDLTCNTIVDGVVKDDETGKPLAGAKVSILNKNSELIAETASDNNGLFVLDGDCRDGKYKLVVSKEDYNDGDKMFATVQANDTSGVEISLKKTIKKAATGTDLVQFLSLNPVYFDLDKAAIRPDASITIMKVVAYLNRFPNIKIQVQSHTDIKATAQYNKKLSQKRADNTVTYLVANGIDASRLSGKGFGKTRLANDCTTREKCSDEQHQKNRRSEFVVIE